MYTLQYQNDNQDRCLIVSPCDNFFKVDCAVVDGMTLPQKSLDKLIFQALHAVSLAKARPVSPQQLPPPAISSSPVSVCSLNDNDLFPGKGNLSGAVITELRELVFSLPSNAVIKPPPPLIEEHTPLLISIEGNIGAGKSTLFNQLRLSHPEWNFIEEPVDFWATLKNDKGQSLFELYYHSQERWSYTFQNCAVLSRYQYIEETIAKKKAVSSGRQVYITERCLDTDHNVFARMLHDDGKMDSLEYALYERWIQQLKKSSTPLSGIIYLDTPADVCADRIRGRNREGEEGIPLQYLQDLQRYQSAWIESCENIEDPTPIVRTSSAEDIENFVNKIVSKNI